MSYRMAAFALSACTPLLACSARLSSPVRIPLLEVHAVQKRITQTGKDATGNDVKCTENVVQFLSLPGKTYDVNVETGWAWFSKNEFSVTFYDSGALKQLTLNSDPQLDETIRSSATLVKELGSVVASAVARSAGCPTEDVARDEQVECVLPLDQWRSAGYRCPSVVPTQSTR